MTSTGLLVVSNIKRIQQSLSAIQKYVNSLYIHLNIPPTKINPVPSWTKVISRIYSESLDRTPHIDLKILVTPLKSQLYHPQKKNIDILFSDGQFPEICDSIRANFNIPKETIFLTDERLTDIEDHQNYDQETKVYDTVVLGGTFDRIHVGHKIFLTAAVLRACKRLVVGVTDETMLKSKKLPELILPVERRIEELREFLLDIDSTLQYDVVPISDPFGPTQTDPDMDMIVVSAETLRGGKKVNEIRAEKQLKQLDIFCIEMVESSNSDAGVKELKVSSSNTRIDLLGTRINKREPRPNLPAEPYIIGLTGGIASGKSKMAHRLQALGAHVFDCDKIAHEIYEPGQVCYQKVVQHFGDKILSDDKRIDRTKLGPIVFGNPAELEKLNSIVWPELLIEVKRRIKLAHENSGAKIVVIEAAILHKAGWDTECHEVWSMIIPPEEAVRRIVERNNLTEEEARKRIGSQLDNRSVVQRSNVIFSSEWSPDYTNKQAEKAWKMITTELKENKYSSRSCL